MPFINITMGQTTEEQKKELIKNMTKSFMDVTKMPEEKIMTIIYELPSENFGVGQKVLRN